MAVPRGSFSPPFKRVEPARIRKDGVIAVGCRAIVRRPPHEGDGVTLTTEDGRTSLGTVQVGAEVEITAWRSRRSAPALYRVLIRSEGKEGWTTAASLESPPPTTQTQDSRAPVERRGQVPAPQTSRAGHKSAGAR
jgi:hypothetical protein